MAHFLTNGEEYQDLIYNDDYRAYLITRSKSAADYRFGRMQGKRARVQARRASRRINGYWKSMIEAIANSKLRRMERELELRGIRFDRSSASWLTGKSQPTGRWNIFHCGGPILRDGRAPGNAALPAKRRSSETDSKSAHGTAG